MIRIGEAAVFTILLTAFVVTMLILTLGLSPVARLVPLMVAIPTLIMVVAQLVVDLRPRPTAVPKGKRRIDFFQSEEYREKLQFQSGRTAPSRDAGADLAPQERSILLWLVMLPICIYLFGFAVSLPLFVLLYLRWRTGEGWLFSVSMALAAAVLIYAVFALIPQGGPYEGMLWTWWERAGK